MDKDIDRPYAQRHGAANILNWLPEVERVLQALPGEAETDALRDAWLAITRAAAEGKLYAGDKVMDSTESQRAKWAKAVKRLEPADPAAAR